MQGVVIPVFSLTDRMDDTGLLFKPVSTFKELL